MSTTYFNNKKSNIEKLTKKTTKNKDTSTIKKNDDEKEIDDKDLMNKDINHDNYIDKNVVENFSMSNPFGDKKSDNDGDNKDKPKKTKKETDPMSNIFSSSDKKSTTTTTSPTSKTESNTEKSAKKQLKSDKFLIFALHALMCVFLAYVWGFLATNYIYLSSEPKDNLDYILPVDEYKLPYTNDPESKSWYTYGFPYNLAYGRDITSDDMGNSKTQIMNRQLRKTYYLWLSKAGEETNQTDKYEADFFGALAQYLFAAVYGGLGKGGRGLLRNLISIISIVSKDENDSWESMKDSFPRKVTAFILFPFIALNFLIPGIAILTGIATFIFGILQEHIWWGLFFSCTIGMFIAICCAIYMAIQTIYVFFFYPWLNNRGKTGKWVDIFNSIKTYMLFAFYLLICFYGYEDLGTAGGAGIMFIVVVSMIMQRNKDSDE